MARLEAIRLEAASDAEGSEVKGGERGRRQ